MKVAFTVPGEPVPKGRPRFGQGRTYTPQATRDYDEWVQAAARQAMRGLARLTGPVELSLLLVLPIPSGWSQARRRANADAAELHIKRPDFDNLAKAVADACNQIVWDDDGQVARAVITKVYGDRPRVEVVAQQMGLRFVF